MRLIRLGRDNNKSKVKSVKVKSKAPVTGVLHF
jgi:hypothetical protein